MTRHSPRWLIPTIVVYVVVFPVLYPVMWLSDRRYARQWAALEARIRASASLETREVLHARWWTREFPSIAEGSEALSIFELGLVDGSHVFVSDEIGHYEALLATAGKLPEPIRLGHDVGGLLAVTWLVSTAVLGIGTAFILAIAC